MFISSIEKISQISAQLVYYIPILVNSSMPYTFVYGLVLQRCNFMAKYSTNIPISCIIPLLLGQC